MSTSNSGRSSGVAKRTPLVATTGTWNAAARSDSFVVGFLVAQAVPLQFDEDAIASEHTDDPIQQSADAVAPRVEISRPASATSPPVHPSSSSSASEPSPLGERSFIRVIRRQSCRYPSCDSTSTGRIQGAASGISSGCSRRARDPGVRAGACNLAPLARCLIVNSAPMMGRRPTWRAAR